MGNFPVGTPPYLGTHFGGKMKNLLLAMLIAAQGYGAISNNAKHKLNNYMGQVARETNLGTIIDEGGSRVTKDGHQVKNLAVATYDYSVLGGATTTSGGSSLGVTLPVGAVITRSWVDTLVTPAGSGATISVHALTDQDIMVKKTASGMSVLIEGVSTGTAATMKKMTTDSTIKYVSYDAALTAGKFKVYVEYVMSALNN